jgi:hypothetical protein
VSELGWMGWMRNCLSWDEWDRWDFWEWMNIDIEYCQFYITTSCCTAATGIFYGANTVSASCLNWDGWDK